MRKKGYFEMYCGPMKSGKTKMMFDKIEKLNYMKNIRYGIFRPDIDSRSLKLESKAYKKEHPSIKINVKNPEKILDYLEKFDYFLIDETNFFEESLFKVVKTLLKNKKYIIGNGLDLDFKAEPFGATPRLLALANKVVKLKGICDYKDCNNLSTRTQRLVNGKPAKKSSPKIEVENQKKEITYECRCLIHHEI